MKKITPFLWFDRNTEEAMTFYTSTFSDSKIVEITRYPEGPLEGPMKGFENKVLTGVFELMGQRFMGLDGGPIFTFNPAISFHVKCAQKEAVDAIWEKLSVDGKVLMELGSYPFSERYGWLQDKFGVSWQIIYVGQNPIDSPIIPVLMFVGEVAGKAEEAVNFYTTVFKESPITATGPSAVGKVMRWIEGEGPDKPGTVKYASFSLLGQEFGAMDSAHEHKFAFNEAISFMVHCDNQVEVDYFWGKLSAVPASEQCGWLKDKFGVSWQIIPRQLNELLADSNKEKSKRVMDAMMNMKKIVVADLEKAAMGA